MKKFFSFLLLFLICFMLHADNPIILKISYIGYDVCTITPLDENSVVKSGKKKICCRAI